ncbi:MAG TPA: HAMP domain-containing sensor histidine kinase [Candidatus Paceibacterota bacterium]
MTFILGILGILVVVCAALSLDQANRNRGLREQLKKAEDTIARTSRLMIEKNVELFDQNVNQQKQLAVKDDFIAIASHQLRTPLNEIKWGMGELLESAENDKEQASYQRIFDSAKRMEKIVEDLLQFVEVEQAHSRAAITPYDADVVVRRAAGRISKDFPDTDISLSLDLAYGETLQSMDAAAFEMIVDNLIENAYHYTPAPGTIKIRTRKGEGGTFQLEIEDSGIGIPTTMSQNMFLKFRRSAEAIERNKEGSGLGLYIVKTLLERGDGAISFESKEGKGTIFRVVLLKEKSFTPLRKM